MAIDLFRHNQEAYTAALQMLSQCGKAAVIHPTGTGKSFIGFKLCEEHPEQRICWLSPSEYIFKTQLENIRAAADGWQPENVSFFTYAKLMLMSRAELEAIRPDAIILDEFHRCGAEMWGQGVQNLLTLFPQVPLLGLSATNIRYLDNRRDMADELFDGHIASEMTLGEAIVRGILNPPKYVLSVFSYQQGLEKYQQRVLCAKNKATRDAAQKYLEALRRALEKAEGMDELFRKHIPQADGKYIVFCANVQHMREMMDKAKSWFVKVDPHLHMYAAYADSPETSAAFDAFKQDESGHLKLLFCIDMLNEGVHVEDVSGVILLRPTVSPIIYKQQIGRALSANKKTNAVIFDIVLNIENLYSIGAIEDEMQLATVYYRERGEDSEIVNEHFRVIDEVHDCMELFEKLNDTLGASWERMYALAETYYRENGDLEVPKRYLTPEGYSLGSWLATQRKVYAGKVEGVLHEWQIEKLSEIGMRWESASDVSWAKYYAAAEAYYRQNGHLRVPITEKDFCGAALGRWIAQLRTYRCSGIHGGSLTPERIEKLDAIGMVWDVPNYLWAQNYAAAVEYHRTYGDLSVPSDYVTPEGIRLGAWLGRVRSAAQDENHRGAALTKEQRALLDELGMVWGTHADRMWERGYQAACQYHAAHGDLKLSYLYETPDGIKLGRWLYRQRELYPDKLSPDKIEKLNCLGMVWEKPDPWEEKMTLVEQYYAEHGDVRIPANEVVEGVWLGRWLSEQAARLNGKESRGSRKNKPLSPEQTARLEGVGIRRNVSRTDIRWEEQYAEAADFAAQNGHLNVPAGYCGSNGKQLAVWLKRQRKACAEGKLTPAQIEKLNAIGMVWAAEDAWQIGWQHAAEYREAFGNLNVPFSYAAEDGYKLGKWLAVQRDCYAGNGSRRLTEEEIEKLNRLGMIWRAYEDKWESQYRALCQYQNENGTLDFPRDYQTADGTRLMYWVENQRERRRKGKLSAEQVKKLDDIGFDWLTPAERAWEDGLEYARVYQAQRGDLNAGVTYRATDGYFLGRWLQRQRDNRDRLTELQIVRLNALGMCWEKPDGRAKAYRK